MVNKRRNRGRPNKCEPLAEEITKLWKQGKDDKDIEWELKKRVPRLVKQGKIKDINDLPAETTIAAFRREYLDNNQKMVEKSGLDLPWHLGTISNPVYGIPATCIPTIFSIQNYIEQNPFLMPLSIREARWVYIFSAFYKSPPSNNKVKDLYTKATYYAEREIISELSGKPLFNTTELDNAVRHDNLNDLIAKDADEMINDFLNGTIDSPIFQAIEVQESVLTEGEKREFYDDLLLDELREITSLLTTEYKKSNPNASKTDLIEYLLKIMNPESNAIEDER